MRVPELLRRGWPVVLEMAATMPGPVDIVWELITDWEHQDDWMLEASDFVVTSQEREGEGVTAEASITIAGITTRDEVRVVVWKPARHLAIEHLGWVSGRGDLMLTALGASRTQLYWREELRPGAGALGAAGMTLLKPLMARIFKRDLRVLAGLVRARARSSGHTQQSNRK